eukprot:scaffold25722_cov109-Isochrysis_galbana.AAC.4
MDYVGKWLPGQNHMSQVGPARREPTPARAPRALPHVRRRVAPPCSLARIRLVPRAKPLVSSRPSPSPLC